MTTAAAWVLGLCGLFVVVSCVVGVVGSYSPVPYWDQWDGALAGYMRFADHQWFVLWEQHNEHRLLLPRLIFWTDIRWFGGRNVINLVANLVLLGALAVTVSRIASRGRRVTWTEGVALAGVIATMAFSWMQDENLTWGFENQWFGAYLFAMLAFDALARSRDTSGLSRQFLLALLYGAFAAYWMASGLLVLPVLLALSLYIGLSKQRVALIGLATAVVWAAYFRHYASPPAHGSVLSSVHHHPIEMVEYVLLYLGGPVWAATAQLSLTYLAGAIVVVATLVGLWLGRNRETHALALLAFAVFVCGSAFITAGGRLPFGLESAFAHRYTTSSLFAWLSLLLYFWVNARRPLARAVNAGLFALALVAVLSCQAAAFSPDQDRLFALKSAGLALREDVYDSEWTYAVYPGVKPLQAIAQAAQARGLSIFEPCTRDYPCAPEQPTANRSCDGAIDTIKPTGTPGRYMATGWIFDRDAKVQPTDVVVVNAQNELRGYGIVGSRRPDVETALKLNVDRVGWTSFFRADGKTIRVLAKHADTYCALPVTGKVPEQAAQ
ncbi:hypothetical protein [Paraburkholderia caffeinilytica]|uniref:hypothetical protein n=1 Tax=Paraburkholderia caffeinilytica TaxID=1761016 RepID=UPI0013BE93FD|nr:hypothetical protein [Paraburkholderia caffeinilytica]